MEDPQFAKAQMLLAAVYACGRLSAEEKITLVSRRLFTPKELASPTGVMSPSQALAKPE
jgi:hypothetical protein